jgi:16S rRNA (guanine527-N7)-methyltransferase
LRALVEEVIVDNLELESALYEGASKLGVALATEAGARLVSLARELLRWNAKVNLTSIDEPLEVVEKHLLDSLAVLPELEGARSLIDLGAGAGFPGLPLKVVCPQMEVTLVESVAKKVGFMKHAIATLGLGPGVRAMQARAGGDPLGERLSRAEVVISRALMEVGPWLELGRLYAAPTGRVLAMLGRPRSKAGLEEMASRLGWRVDSLREYRLPFSQAERSVVSFGRAAQG